MSMMPVALPHDDPIAVTVTPTFMPAAVAVGLLDDHGFRAGGVGRHRQSDAERGQGGQSHYNLAHAKFSYGLNDASTREPALAFQIMF
jgi:hypothetical protein